MPVFSQVKNEQKTALALCRFKARLYNNYQLNGGAFRRVVQ